MSDVNGVNQNQNVFEQINSKNQANSTAQSQASQDSEMFTQLMIAQLKNQDPSSPADTSDFMQQIATMSQVESINNLSTSVESMSQAMMTSQAALQASSMVGRSVYVPGDTAEVGTSLNPYAHGSFEVETSAKDVRISVYDSAGSLVDTMDLGIVEPGVHDFAWQMPFNDDGEPEMPPGDYTFKVERLDEDVYVPIDTTMAHRVNSVSLGENGIGMTVNTNAGSFDSSEVRQIGV